MADKATELPGCNKFDSFFTPISENDMNSILGGIHICRTRTKQAQEDRTAVDVTIRFNTTAYTPGTNVNKTMADADHVRKFQMDLYDMVEKHPHSHLFVLEHTDAAQCFAICLASLVSIFAGQGRNVMFQIVDPNYSPICGWSYRQIWRKWAAEQQKVSALMIMGAAAYMKAVAGTYHA